MATESNDEFSDEYYSENSPVSFVLVVSGWKYDCRASGAGVKLLSYLSIAVDDIFISLHRHRSSNGTGVPIHLAVSRWSSYDAANRLMRVAW
jgi:hypothetical protein